MEKYVIVDIEEIDCYKDEEGKIEDCYPLYDLDRNVVAYFINEEWYHRCFKRVLSKRQDMQFQEIKKLGLDLLDIVSEKTKVSKERMCGKDRHRLTVMAREQYAYYARKLGLSLKQIGRILWKDHTTVMHYLKLHEQDDHTPFFHLQTEVIGFKVKDYLKEHSINIQL